MFAIQELRVSAIRVAKSPRMTDGTREGSGHLLTREAVPRAEDARESVGPRERNMFQYPRSLKVNVCIAKLTSKCHAKGSPRAFGQERKIERLEGPDGENAADEVAVGTIEWMLIIIAKRARGTLNGCFDYGREEGFDVGNVKRGSSSFDGCFHCIRSLHDLSWDSYDKEATHV
jgi:hypothetical protein